MAQRPDTYVSTRGDTPATDFAEALLRGMAPDGGLYMPQTWPTLSADAWGAGRGYAAIAQQAMAPFIGDALPPGSLDRALDRLVAGFIPPEVTPLVRLEDGLYLLELFHGPTAAFKDLAMQLAASLASEALAASGETLTLVTATSGDTGAAAVAAFANQPRIRLIVLHPHERVSAVQRRQMTTVEADNVLNLAVRGDFDDCQRLVKGLLADEMLRAHGRFSSVNSINWARLAGQIPYYVSAVSQLAAMGETRAPVFVVPTGNFGDAFAGIAARKMGLPVAGFVAAVNANDALARAINEGVYARKAAVETASVSMDVQAPSNFERLVFEASGRDAGLTAGLFADFARDGRVTLPADLLEALRAEVSAVSIDEASTRTEIAHAHATWGEVVCPHTAVALSAARGLDRSGGPVIALATAHPAKFGRDVAPVLGFDPDPPRVIRDLGDRAERFEIIGAEAGEALTAVRGFAGQARQA
ncbi:MAG: threonine synthase [Caulobacteraceae bacterium]|nr:threonine synthase [Caulobacteraceae bacterium]